MSYKSISLSLLVIATAVLTTWTVVSYRPQQSPALPSTAMPDAFMEEVTATIMNKYGKPALKIVTPKMVHFVENDTLNIDSPVLTVYRNSPEPWHISAKYARTTGGIEKVNFWENVVIQHAADFANPKTLIKTPSLTVYPGDQIAETADQITLIQPSIVVTATGMHADITTGTVKLLSEARGEYAPNS